MGVALRGHDLFLLRESKVDKTSQTPKVPNVCERFDVSLIETKELVKLLKFKLYSYSPIQLLLT